MASGSRSITGGSDETFLHDCDICKYNNKISEAISFCTVCTEYLCKACEDSHRGSKATREHKIVTGSYMPSSTVVSKPLSPDIYCEHHKTMTLNVYCENHDDVICGTCKLTDHRKCKTTDLRKRIAMVKMQEAFDHTIKQMAHLKKEYKAFKDLIKRVKGEIKSQTKSCIDDMHEMIRVIKDLLNKLAKDFEKEASDIEQNTIEKVEYHVTIANDALNQINSRMKTLEDCRKSQDNDLMFVCIKKANVLKRKYDDALFLMENEAYSKETYFKPNDAITDVLLQLKSLGTIEVKTKPSHEKMSLLNMTFGERREIDVGCRTVWDCTFFGDSHLVLACVNDGLKLLNKHFKVQSQLSDFSLSVATINENEIIVTQGNRKQLQRVSIFPKMAVTKTLKMDRDCYGVYFYNNEIYMTCHDSPGKGEARVLNMDGTLQRQFGVNDGRYMFEKPDFIKVSRDRSKVIISDADTHKVTCLSQEGVVLHQYTNREMVGPTGLYVDDEGTVLACIFNSHNVHMINRDGRKQKIILLQKDKTENPLGISYRPRDGCLVVGLYKTEKSLIVYQT